MNRSDEIRALGDLTGDVLAETVRVVEDVHRAVSDRVDSALPAPAKPISTIVRASTAATYATVRAAHRWIPRGAAAVAASRTAQDAPSILEHRAATRAVAAVNGIWGAAATDRISATTMLSLFHHGEPLGLEAIPNLDDARRSLVVFVHGLAETEADWSRQPSGATARRVPYPERVETDLDVTALTVRYSTGHAIGTNGAELSALLEQIASRWPVPLHAITLVGHSMGGLISRSAAHHGHGMDTTWLPRLRLVVTLGTPHLGAPLSKAVHLTERALTAFPESAPIGRILATRSAGVRDLTEGRIFVGDAAALDQPLVPGVVHCTVGSTLTQDPRHPVAVLVGDGIVPMPSATGRGRRRQLDFQVDNHVGGVSHLALLNEPSVYQLIRGWIEQHATT